MRSREFITEMNRRGFLKSLASFAASAAVPAPVVKLLATPAGVATMPIPAGIALLKGIQNHLDQWDAEDDDDYFEAYEDMAAKLGFDATNADGEYIDPLSDLLNLYRKNPEQSAQQLIKHLQSVAINPATVKSSFRSRADDPSDWRYQSKQKHKKPEPTGGYNSRVAQAQQAQQAVQQVATGPGSLARAATMAKAGIDKLSKPNVIQQMPAKDMGRVEPTALLPAPTKPEVDLTPDLRSKEKVPTRDKDVDDGEVIGFSKKKRDARSA